MLKVLFIGESVDDHAFVIKSVVKELEKITKEKGIRYQFSYMGSFTKSFKEEMGVRTKSILSSSFLLPFSLIQSFFWLFVNTPDLIFSKGGQVTLPIILSAQILRIPVFIHETESSLSLINKFISKIALTVFTSFNNTRGLDKKKEMRLGYPFQKKSLSDYISAQNNLSSFFPKKTKRPILFFISTFKNSEKINDFILNVLTDLTQTFYIFHQVTEEEYSQVKKESEVILSEEGKKFYHLFSCTREINYINKLEDVQVVSDIIILESTEKIIFEMAAMNKPTILIIFSDKTDNREERQRIESAYSYANSGASIVFEKSNLKRGLFLDKLNSLFSEPNIKELKKMSEKAKEFSTPNAGRLIATYLFEYWKLKI